MAPYQITFESLPDEVAHEIFTRCLDPLNGVELEISKNDARGPLLSKYPVIFTSVCKYWTYMALTCPKLWATISIIIDQPGLQEYTPPLPILGKWIDRSSSFPLSFSIKQYGQGGDFEGPYEPKSSRVLEMFIPHHLRWRQVFLFPGRSRTGLTMLNNTSSAPMTYPELRQIGISNKSWNHSEMEGDAAGLVHLLKHSPRLTSISIYLARSGSNAVAGRDSRTRYMDLIHTAIPWHQIEELSFLTNTVTPLRVLQILGKESPKLRSVIFDVKSPHGEGDEDDDDDDDDFHNPFQQHSRSRAPEYPLAYHERLESLRLIPSDIGELTIILKRATLPKLRDLTLFVNHQLYDDEEAEQEAVMAAEFKNFVRRSRCPLEKLRYISLSPNFLCPGSILECVASVSASLQILNLQAYSTDALLKALTVPAQRLHGTRVLCPNLHSIQFVSWRYRGRGLLAEMVESRWNPSSEMQIARLQNVSVGFCFDGFPFEDQFAPPPDASILTEDVDRLQVLNSDGSNRKIDVTVNKDGVATELVK